MCRARIYSGERGSSGFTARRIHAHLHQQAMSGLFDLIYDQIIGSGIDEVYCISINDAFVMHQ